MTSEAYSRSFCGCLVGVGHLPAYMCSVHISRLDCLWAFIGEDGLTRGPLTCLLILLCPSFFLVSLVFVVPPRDYSLSANLHFRIPAPPPPALFIDRAVYTSGPLPSRFLTPCDPRFCFSTRRPTTLMCRFSANPDLDHRPQFFTLPSIFLILTDVGRSSPCLTAFHRLLLLPRKPLQILLLIS